MDLQDLAMSFKVLFTGLDRAYGEYVIPVGAAPSDTGKIKGKAQTVKKPVTAKVWEEHLSGKIGLGLVPIREDGTCSWGAIDLDFYNDFDHAGLERKLAAMKLPLVVCRTKSGGCHLYLFLREPVQAKIVRKKLLEFEMALGYVNSEIFPKQDAIASEEDYGNWINMPYQKAMLTTRYAIRSGKAVPAEEFVAFAWERALTLKELKALKPIPVDDEFSDAPPCLQYLVNTGFPTGTKNNALFSMGVFAKKKYPDDWEEKVFEYNTKYMSGTFAEVKGLIRTLSKKDYVYKCSDQPICAVCNKNECKKRTYGIGRGTSSGSGTRKGDGPCILENVDRPVTRYIPAPGSNDEPQYVFKISGIPFDVTCEMLRDQRRFHSEYFKKFHRLVPLVKDTIWIDQVNELMEEAEEIELPPDAGPEGQFLLHLERFCTGKVQGRAMDDLTVGKPFTTNGRTYFRSQDLMKYLDQQHFREFKERAVWAILRRHGAKHDQDTINGRCVKHWSVAEFPVDKTDLPQPDLTEEKRF